ncbi:aminotransferase class IV [Roseixanthobacter glucoisosaccharinicivorans]|uniref:aminotransferase class IV n=1 Tax=Roseixanthobacter glucoisosaccharinicivorans TaxID=3119923 RepID=UPI003727E4FA
MIVWLNGALVDHTAARVAPDDRGFTLGDGLFETVRARNGALWHMHAHLARLAAGARVLGLPLPQVDLTAAARAVLEANTLSDGVVRITLSRGSGPRGVLPPAKPEPTLLITAAPATPPAPPARLIIARVTRRNELSPLHAVKSLNYLDNILARQEAAAQGADDALLLNTRGRVAESTIANLFVVIGNMVLTPPVCDGALPGIMRAEVLREHGSEATLSVEDLAQAQEMFLTSSLGIRSVSHLDGRDLLATYPVAERLRASLGL